MSFEEKLGLVVEREWTDRENRRLARRLKDAKLGTDACLEDVWCEPARGLDKDVVRTLATCQWVRAKQNVIAIGATGVGKSFLGAALAQAACRSGYRALCTRVPRLVNELAIARADGSYAVLLAKLARTEVLVLDDFLIAPLKDTERRDLLEILEDRYDRSSTVITTQVPTKSGTRCSPTPPSQTRYATGSCTTPTCSPSRERRSERRRDSEPNDLKPTPDHPLVASLRR